MSVKISTLATSGSGTDASPWTGFEAAANAALAAGQSIEIDGVCAAAASITPSVSCTSIFGENGEKSWLRPVAGFAGPLIDINATINQITVRDFRVSGLGMGDGRTGIYLRGNSSRHRVHNMYINQLTYGIRGHFSWVNSIRDCVIGSCTIPIWMEQHGNAWIISGGSCANSGDASIKAELSSSLLIEGINIAEMQTFGIILNDMDGVTINANYFENVKRRNISMTRVKGARISGNHFSGVNGGVDVDATSAKLLGDVIMQGCEAVSVTNNWHDVMADSRQVGHIHLYDAGGVNTKCEIGPNANAIVKRSTVPTSSGAFPDTAITEAFYLDGTCNKDAVPFNGSLFNDYGSGNVGPGASLVSIPLENSLTYDLHVVRMTGANAGDEGNYQLVRFGTSMVVKTVTACAGMTISINSANRAVIQNTGGSTPFVRFTLTQRMPA